MIAKRIISDIVLFLCVLFAPWWITAGLGFLCVWYFDQFIEAVFVALFMDILYGAGSAYFWGFEYANTVIVLPLYLLIASVKKKLII